MEIEPFFMKHNTIIAECVSIETDIIQAQLFLFKCCIVFGWSHYDPLINCINIHMLDSIIFKVNPNKRIITFHPSESNT